jgi:hypothetical protein
VVKRGSDIQASFKRVVKARGRLPSPINFYQGVTPNIDLWTRSTPWCIACCQSPSRADRKAESFASGTSDVAGLPKHRAGSNESTRICFVLGLNDEGATVLCMWFCKQQSRRMTRLRVKCHTHVHMQQDDGNGSGSGPRLSRLLKRD